jgi:hypothetical protein
MVLEKEMQTSFNNLLIEAIDEVLSSLGQPIKNHVYIRLQEDFSLAKNDIPEQIELFSEFLTRTFGPSASFIQIKIMKAFNAKLAEETTNRLQPITLFDDFSFTDAGLYLPCLYS